MKGEPVVFAFEAELGTEGGAGDPNLRSPDGFVLGRIYDEGPNGRSDDDTAGDGRFSGSLQIPSGFPTGTYTWSQPPPFMSMVWVVVISKTSVAPS